MAVPEGQDSTPRTSPAIGAQPSPTANVGPAPEQLRLHALVVGDDIIATFPLPEHGEVRIGRAPESEVLIDDPSISRTHAILTLGPTLTLVDAGSANGTRVRGRSLPANDPVEIAPGEAIELGSATVIVQRRAAPIRTRPRIWSHDYFEVRLEEECARSRRRGTPFAVLRLTCSSPESPEALRATLSDLVRMSDVVAEYGPRDYEILLVDTTEEEVATTTGRLLAGLARVGVSAQVGVATYPVDGRNPDELIALAGTRARGRTPGDARAPRTEIVADRAMRDLYALAGRIANGTISVLILGETGVGKEILAEKIHRLSPRVDAPYLRLNCAALSESLLESELFGHERGAFTGAVAVKPGLLETADGGTVFLDEVGELPLSIQVKLLRVIEERVVIRVGGLKPRPLDVRFVAATNRDLEAEIARGTFRQDLFFRLNGATLLIPPLRERTPEIPALARAFVAVGAKQAGLAREPTLSKEAVDSLLAYAWPGNIRELRNVVERAVLLCGGATIRPEHLPLEKMRASAPAARPPATPAVAPGLVADRAPSRRRSILRRGERMSPEEERAAIEAALHACGGNQTRAAKLLGIGRRTLFNRMREFKFARPRG